MTNDRNLKTKGAKRELKCLNTKYEYSGYFYSYCHQGVVLVKFLIVN